MAKKIPLRQCVGCGEMKGKKEMLRVLKTPEDEICLDATGKKKRTWCIYMQTEGMSAESPEE